MLHKFELEFESPDEAIDWGDILGMVIKSPLFKRVKGSLCAVKPLTRWSSGINTEIPSSDYKLKMKIPYNLRVFENFISMNNKKVQLVIGDPDAMNDGYHTSVYIADHLNILIHGSKKGDLTVRIESDEYPTKLIVEDTNQNLDLFVKMKRDS